LATSLATSEPQWLAAGTYDGSGGNDLRNSDITATMWSLPSGDGGGSVMNVQGGVVGGTGLSVIQASGMTVGVGAGSFVVPNTASAIAGGYRSTMANGGVLTVATADPSNPRTDIVVAAVNDEGTSASSGSVQIITGTPAASPSVPTAPANSITLAQIAVAAAATSITSANITDLRPYTVAAGGVVKAALGSNFGADGMMGFDPSSRHFYHNTTTAGSKQAAVLPFKTAYATRNTNAGLTTTPTLIASVTIVTDGFTDIEITYHIVGFFQPVNVGVKSIAFTVEIDGTQLTEIDQQTNSDDQAGISHGGFTDVYQTSSLSGDTPSAGTHTVTFHATCPAGGSGDEVNIRASATRNAYLRVNAAVL
jgi:hypothetical protein